jgi:hypothetical protein
MIWIRRVGRPIPYKYSIDAETPRLGVPLPSVSVFVTRTVVRACVANLHLRALRARSRPSPSPVRGTKKSELYFFDPAEGKSSGEKVVKPYFWGATSTCGEKGRPLIDCIAVRAKRAFIPNILLNFASEEGSPLRSYKNVPVPFGGFHPARKSRYSLVSPVDRIELLTAFVLARKDSDGCGAAHENPL